MALPLALCAISQGCAPPTASTAPEALPDTVTFNAHIAPLLHRHCAPCHRDDGPGPFPLLTFNDAAKRAKTIRQVTSDRFMPPWPADPYYSRFIGERILSDYEIALLAAWVDGGALRGDGEPPAAPRFPPGSMLGEPDMVIEFTDSIPIPGDNTDRFFTVKVPFSLPAERYVKAIEFVPGNRKLVHHMNGHLVNYAPGSKSGSDAQRMMWVDNSLPSISIYRELALANDDGTYPELSPSVVNYLPGAVPVIYPMGIGTVRMARQGAFLLKSMHYGPSPVDAYDRSRLNIFFTDGPPERPLREMILGTLGVSPVRPHLVIPPDSMLRVHTRQTLTEDISLLTINPHMHLLGKSFLAYAMLPTGDTVPLVRIPRWDFRWQDFYTFPKMLHLPKGTVIHAEGVFDNTRDNPNNPFDPPRMVVEPQSADMRTTDEMFQFILSYVSYRKGDEHIRLGLSTALGKPR